MNRADDQIIEGRECKDTTETIANLQELASILSLCLGYLELIHQECQEHRYLDDERSTHQSTKSEKIKIYTIILGERILDHLENFIIRYLYDEKRRIGSDVNRWQESSSTIVNQARLKARVSED